MSDGSESQLIADCRAGDPAAWDRLFDAHYQPVSRFVWQISAGFSSEDVEEICQETFLTVIKSLDSFQGQSRLQTWIFRIAANKAHDFIEKQRALKRGGGMTVVSLNAEDPHSGQSIDPPTPARRPDEVLMGQETGATLTEALVRLGGPCQEIIELRYFADLSYEEISTALSLNPKTVSSRLSKCLDKLEELARPLLSGEKNPNNSVQSHNVRPL